ncbi:cytochrome C [Candidatus Moduliflexota bacterium]
MMKILMPALALSLMTGLAACAGTDSMPTTHPEEVSGAPVCSECHSEWQAAYDHTGDYARSHRFYASRDKEVCLTCHRESFCSECHGYEVELKPSDTHKDSPRRELPHRGDYLTQHKIDGRINPASCYKCHGRRNDWRCKECHR